MRESGYTNKRLPPEERRVNLRDTVMASINQKLQRMDIDQLREVYKTATRLMQEKK